VTSEGEKKKGGDPPPGSISGGHLHCTPSRIQGGKEKRRGGKKRSFAAFLSYLKRGVYRQKRGGEGKGLSRGGRDDHSLRSSRPQVLGKGEKEEGRELFPDYSPFPGESFSQLPCQVEEREGGKGIIDRPSLLKACPGLAASSASRRGRRGERKKKIIWDVGGAVGKNERRKGYPYFSSSHLSRK